MEINKSTKMPQKKRVQTLASTRKKLREDIIWEEAWQEEKASDSKRIASNNVTAGSKIKRY